MNNRHRTALACALILAFAGAAFGQNFRGTYTMTSGGVTLTLTLDQAGGGRISGTLSSTSGARFQLEGTVEEGIVTGTSTGASGQSYFEAEFEGAKLIFTLVEVGAGGTGESRSLEFVRAAAGPGPAPKAPAAKPASPAPAKPSASPAPKTATPGRRLSDPGLGISFIAPADWAGGKQGDAFLLGSNTHKGFIVIMSHGYTSLAQMSGEASEGINDQESGIFLAPSSRLQPFGSNGMAGEFSGTVQGVQARAFAVGLISPRGGGGVTIMAAVETSSYSASYPEFVRAIASSLTFSAPHPSSPSGGGASDAGLMDYFKGEYYSYSGGSTLSGGAGTERTVTLCPDGTYRDSYEFSASGTDWGGASSRGGAARWSIRGDRTRGVIIVTYANGQRKQVSYQVLSKGEGTILFDGIKFAYAGAPKCR